MMNTTQLQTGISNNKGTQPKSRHPSTGESTTNQAQGQTEKQHNSQQSQSQFEQQFLQYKAYAEQESQSTFEITKILKQNINKFYKINKIDVAEQARLNRQTNNVVSLLDKFATKVKYSQNYNYLVYEEATSGEDSPKQDFTNSSDDSSQGQYDRRSDDDNEFSNSNDNDEYSSGDDDSEDDYSSDENQSSESQSDSNTENNHHKSKKYEQMDEEERNQGNKSDKKKGKKHHSDDEDDMENEFSDDINQGKNNKSNNKHNSDDNDEHLFGQNLPEQDNLLYQLQSKMALEKKNQQKDRQSSSSRERNKKGSKNNAKNDKKKSIKKRSKHRQKDKKKKRNSRDSPKKRQSNRQLPRGSNQQKSALRKKLNEGKSNNNGNFYNAGQRDVASLDDIFFNFFDSHSYDIVSNLKEAELYPDIPKIYIEDPQNECDEEEVYKIVVSLAKLDTSAVKNKKKVRNFSIIYVENVKVMIFDFYRKSTALIVSKNLLEQPTSKNNHQLLAKSLIFKWALDKRAYPEYLKNYFACIFRNLPKLSAQQISQYILNKHPHLKLKCVEEPSYIKNQFCTIVQYESLEDCEYACSVFHKQTWSNPQYKVKVHTLKFNNINKINKHGYHQELNRSNGLLKVRDIIKRQID